MSVSQNSPTALAAFLTETAAMHAEWGVEARALIAAGVSVEYNTERASRNECDSAAFRASALLVSGHPEIDACDAARYRVLKERFFAADFAWGEKPGQCVLVFAMKEGEEIGADLDVFCDSALAAQATATTASRPWWRRLFAGETT